MFLRSFAAVIPPGRLVSADNVMAFDVTVRPSWFNAVEIGDDSKSLVVHYNQDGPLEKSASWMGACKVKWQKASRSVVKKST